MLIKNCIEFKVQNDQFYTLNAKRRRCNIFRTALVFCSLILFFPQESGAQNLLKVAAFLDASADTLNFNGVVLIAKGDSILLHKGYGYSDRAKRISTDKNTVYNIASITKAFTAIAVTKLAEQGKLRLSDPISKFFPDAPPDKRGITVHQLLIHMSGYPSTYAAEGHSHASEALKALWKVPLDSLPGTYSNNNYYLLALITEKVTGRKWEKHIAKTILRPLKMRNTYFWRDKNPLNPPVAESISETKKRRRDYGFLGSTGIYSNAYDLLKFQTVLKGDVILNDSSRAILLGKYWQRPNPLFLNTSEYFSYGMQITEGKYNIVWMRGNEEHWGVSITYWFPQIDISIIVLSNQQELTNGQRPHHFISFGIIRRMDSDLKN